MSEDDDFALPEPFPWEVEFWDMARAFRERAEREGKPENTYPEVDPDKKLTVADVFAYIRACEAHPEIWNAYAFLKERRQQFRAEKEYFRPSEEESWNHHLTRRFRHWYTLKHHPGYHSNNLIVGDVVVTDVVDGELDDLYGAAARSIIHESGKREGSTR